MFNSILGAKVKAFLIHLSISFVFISALLFVVWSIWYPQPLFLFEGGFFALTSMAVVGLILGPILTAIVYRHGKKGLYFDLTLIALLQVGALIYGGQIAFFERQQYIAFTVDRFTVIPASSIDIEKIQHPSLLTNFFERPKFVYVKLPKDSKILMDITQDVLSGGKDFDMYPEYYQNFDENMEKIVEQSHSLPINKMTYFFPKEATKLKKISNQYQIPLESILLFPLQGETGIITVCLSPEGKLLGYLNIDTWSFKN